MSSRAPAPPPRKPLKPIVTLGPQGRVNQSGDWVTSDQNYSLVDAPTKLGLSLVGGSNLTGVGNAGGTSRQNTLTAASNTGDTTLIAGTAATTMIGGSGNNWMDATSSQGTVSLKGGSGSSTMYAANGAATLVGGDKNNFLVAGTGSRSSGQSLVGGKSTGSLYGNTLYGGVARDTLRSGAGYSTLISGSNPGVGNTLIGEGISNVLNANAGNDSLVAVRGNSTLIGGAGSATLLGGAAGSTNWLQSGSNGAGGNTIVGGAGSNTLVAGTGRDSIIGGVNRNLLLVTQANMTSMVNDTISLSTLASAQNTLGVSLSAGTSLGDTFFSGRLGQTARNLRTIQNLSSSSTRITLGGNAEKVGVSTLVTGIGNDTLSVAGFVSNSALLDASRSVNRVSLVGGGTGSDTFLGSRGGYDTMIGAVGNDSFVIQSSALAGSSFGLINGNAGTDTLRLEAAVNLAGTNLNGVSGIEVLQLGSGNNSVGTLQGSGIQRIIGNTGSDTLSANVYGAVRTVTRAGSSTLTLTVLPGTSATMGFAIGQVVTGNGIAVGTTVREVSSTPAIGATPGTVTLKLSTPTTSLISQGGAITGWLNNATLDGSAALGFPPTNAERDRALKSFTDRASSITAANYGIPFELNKDTLAISTLKNDPETYIHRKGDYLVSYGQNNLLIGGQGNGLPDIDLGAGRFADKSSYNTGFGVAFYTPYNSFEQHQVVDNTLISGAFTSNTLVGGSGANLYLINNQPGATAALPTIQNPTTLQSGSTIQFTGNGVRLDDTALSSVSARAAQKIVTANGNNLISIGLNAAQIGIQTIIGGVGSDTFTAPIDYVPSVYFDASRGSGIQKLASGVGNDTLLAGTGKATLIGGDGNNSLKGGEGSNLILSGVGNSTLDGGYGISILQADGGLNRFIVRNRWTRILNPYSLESDPLSGVIARPDPVPVSTTPEIGIVDTYVNFDPIQGDPVSQFSPYYPDNSPSITKSPSFASSDLSSFYNLQYFNLLGSANYGVGNALDNSISAAAANALILGMGGNNTLVASGSGSSLYGNSNAQYASPDLYAYAPIDTRTQAFVDGVMGVAGNNSLVAKGGNSYLDGGPGYDDGLFDGSGSNTLIGTGGNDTVIQSHQADVLSLTGASNTVITSVDLYQAPDNVSDLIVNVTPQLANSGQVSFAGQQMTASYAAVGGTETGYSVTNSLKAGSAPEIVLNNSLKLQVAYGISDGTIYGSDGVSDANLPLTVETITLDPKNPGKQAVTLSWATPLDPYGNPVGQTMGYRVNYQIVATDTDGNILSHTPFLTYLQGTSQDLNGTSLNPRLVVDNLSTSFTDPYTGTIYDSSNSTIAYNFKVTAQETVLPAYTDAENNLIAKPVSLIGGQGNEVVYGGLLDNYNSATSNTRPVLTNNPVNPLDPGTIATPAPWLLDARYNTGLFPVYLAGGLGGDDLLIAPFVNDGSGDSFTAYQYLNGIPTGVTFSGLCTLEGGQGSDTFIVSNGGTGLSTLNGVVTTDAYDHIIKYGSETPTGQHNLIVSMIPYLTLSDTLVDQGMFIDQAWAAIDNQFIGGNRLDNTITGFGSDETLLGSVGRDSITGSGTLIGGTAYGLDIIARALTDFAAGQSYSIYRDTDPVPVPLNGPGTADNSQYWMLNGQYDPLRNSDTLIGSGVLDGGAGNDLMIGGGTVYVSSYATETNGNFVAGQTDITAGDVVSGQTRTVIYTGSDYYWSGLPDATTARLGCIIANNISNLTLQTGDSIARRATGNSGSSGNQHGSDLGQELGSNELLGNEFDNTLDGGGVGGPSGTGVGVDTLRGGGGADQFFIGSQYTNSTKDEGATFSDPSSLIPTYNLKTNATDADYAYIADFDSSDGIILSGAMSDYLIGSAPSGFSSHNINGGTTVAQTHFGIYRATGSSMPDLVAEVQCVGGFSLGGNLFNQSFNGIAVDGTNAQLGGDALIPGLPSGNATGLNYLGFGAMYKLEGSDFEKNHVSFV